jgi:hypothetical protein
MTRGRCNKRTTRDDDATNSRDDERVARQEATHATTSQHNERTSGRRNERTDDPLRTYSKPLASLRSQIWYNVPGRRQQVAPRSRSAPNGIDWRGGSHGYARIKRKPE